jgi:F-type H+-transporting ATPase subunit b
VSAARIRRAALAVMLLVTAWSAWAWAQNPAAAPAKAMHREEAKGEHGESAKAEEEEEAGPAPINWFAFGTETPPFVAMLINFGVLAAAYYFLGKKPIAVGLQSRRDSIAKDIEEAQRMKQEAEARAKVYQAKLETLQEELAQARQTLLDAGAAEGERIVREAEAKADRMRRDAEFLVEQELKQIRSDLLRETVETAVFAAEELLKRRVTPADHQRLAEDYLAELGPKPKTSVVDMPRSSSYPGPTRGEAT